MAYFKDLTPYAYSRTFVGEHINIGWLGKGIDFTKGDVPEGFLSKLKKIGESAPTMGFHLCPVCGEYNGKGWHSSAEYVIRDGIKYYHTPTMIIHYIRDHNYKPPQEFIDVVMNKK